MMETALVFDRNGKTICFHEPAGRSGGSIPDTRSLWDVLWENRANLGGVAHTHPWDGPAHPSHTDLTTFDAIERGLGQKLLWPVVTFTDVAYVESYLDHYSERQWRFTSSVPYEIEGIEELRARSRT